MNQRRINNLNINGVNIKTTTFELIIFNSLSKQQQNQQKQPFKNKKKGLQPPSTSTP